MLVIPSYVKRWSGSHVCLSWAWGDRYVSISSPDHMFQPCLQFQIFRPVVGKAFWLRKKMKFALGSEQVAHLHLHLCSPACFCGEQIPGSPPNLTIWTICLKLGKSPSCPCQAHFQFPIARFGDLFGKLFLSPLPERLMGHRWWIQARLQSPPTDWLPAVMWLWAGCQGRRYAQQTLSCSVTADYFPFQSRNDG